MLNNYPSALTTGEIARRVGQPKHVVEYLIRSREIQPISRAGIARVFGEDALAQIQSELQRVAEQRRAAP